MNALQTQLLSLATSYKGMFNPYVGEGFVRYETCMTKLVADEINQFIEANNLSPLFAKAHPISHVVIVTPKK